MDSRDRTGFYLMMLLLRSFGRARSSLVFYVWLALLDLEVMGFAFTTNAEKDLSYGAIATTTTKNAY